MKNTKRKDLIIKILNMKKTCILFYTLLLSVVILSTGEKVCAETFRIRVMTFNIRMMDADDGINKWTFRKDSVGAFINKVVPDFFGLQEAEYQQLKDVASAAKNYSWIGKGRDDGNTGGEFSPVFYLKSKYRVIQSGTFWLSQTPDAVSFGWDAACRRVVSWAILHNMENKKEVLFANTHFDHVGQTAREQSALLLKERLRTYAGTRPIIVTGDFNMFDTNAAYASMTSYLYPMDDAWKVSRVKEGNNGTFHSFGSVAVANRQKIDYIFLTPDLTVANAVVYNGDLGNGLWLSDHDPHYADLIYYYK
jgi:endonuclease/exonuclease/phosphatase family metal-dependent hydrolase